MQQPPFYVYYHITIRSSAAFLFGYDLYDLTISIEGISFNCLRCPLNNLFSEKIHIFVSLIGGVLGLFQRKLSPLFTQFWGLNSNITVEKKIKSA